MDRPGFPRPQRAEVHRAWTWTASVMPDNMVIQEGTGLERAHFDCSTLLPTANFLFNQFGMLENAATQLRDGNVRTVLTAGRMCSDPVYRPICQAPNLHALLPCRRRLNDDPAILYRVGSKSGPGG